MYFDDKSNIRLFFCALYSKKKKIIIKKNCVDLPELDDPGDASPELNTIDEGMCSIPHR